MTSPVPEIINLSDLIQPLIGVGSKLVDHSLKLLNRPGENYGSLMLALDATVNINGRDTALNAVAKLCPPNEWLQRMFASDVTFKKEVMFYLELVPALLQYQTAHGISNDPISDIFPKCLGARLNLKSSYDVVDEHAVLLLENLRKQRYASADRIVGLDLNEAEIVLKDLARFHAVPLAYRLSHPQEFLTKILPSLNKVNIGQEMFDIAAHRFIESIARHLNLNENQITRFDKGMRLGMEFQKKFPSGNERYSTIVHRDFWVNNTMILKDANMRPVRNKIIDFQVLTYGAPASDLVFFLYSSLMQSVIEKYYDHCIEIYHNAFIECLNNLRCDTREYTLKSFKNEIEIYGPLEASHILIMFKAVFADREAVKEMTDFGLEEMFSDQGITDTYKSRLNWTARQFFDKNWF